MFLFKGVYIPMNPYGPLYTNAYHWGMNPYYLPQKYMYGCSNVRSPYAAYQSIQEGYPHYLSEGSYRSLRLIDNIGGREGAHIYRFKEAVIFKADMDIDIDGHPAAYHPNPQIALLRFNVHGIAKDRRGLLCPVQRQGPNKGFWPSGTSLWDNTYWLNDRCDPRAYVNPEKYPYFVLPHPYYTQEKWGPVRIGDFGVVINTLNNKIAYAIFADAYTGKYIGEGSPVLARKLGINPHSGEGRNDYKGGEQTKSIIYIVFPKSGKGQGTIPTLEEIHQTTDRLFKAWGGMEQVKAIQNQLRN